MSLNIAGIPCDIRERRIVDAIELVTTTIQRDFPDDWERVSKKVRRFTYLPETDDTQHVYGRWVKDKPGLYFDVPGEVQFNVSLLSDVPDFVIVTVVAHELGHAATTEDDFWDRDGVDSEWTSEMCANYYVHKWGFEQENRQTFAEYADWMHEGGLPGDVIEIELMEGGVMKFRVNEDFIFERIG